ncbi:MAG: hypothetical protein M3135_08735 [Actinomycetota bacterium]|nr:hypothetical protein [Actinomycetota bacterium]
MTFAPGETTKVIKVKTKNDSKDEKKKEKFGLLLTGPAGGAFPQTGIIRDND